LQQALASAKTPLASLKVGEIVIFLDADEDDWIDYLMLNNPEFQTRLRRSLQDARDGKTIAFENGKLVSESEN
ncbi:MAG: hypothetical protein EAZ68_02365, partial [Oscillatoriales cyanobacterium]